jgi:hypothetical protein
MTVVVDPEQRAVSALDEVVLAMHLLPPPPAGDEVGSAPRFAEAVERHARVTPAPVLSRFLLRQGLGGGEKTAH